MKLENSKPVTQTDNADVVDFAAFMSAPVGLQPSSNGTSTGAPTGITPPQILERKLTFVNLLGVENARKYATTGRVNFGQIGVLTDVQCVKCKDTHGIPNKHGNGPDWNIRRLALSPVYLTGDNKLIVISETCSWKYFLPLVKSDADMKQSARFIPYFTKLRDRAEELAKRAARRKA